MNRKALSVILIAPALLCGQDAQKLRSLQWIEDPFLMGGTKSIRIRSPKAPVRKIGRNRAEIDLITATYPRGVAIFLMEAVGVRIYLPKTFTIRIRSEDDTGSFIEIRQMERWFGSKSKFWLEISNSRDFAPGRPGDEVLDLALKPWFFGINGQDVTCPAREDCSFQLIALKAVGNP